MGLTHFRTQFQRFGHCILFGVVPVALAMICAGSMMPESKSAATFMPQTHAVAWHGPGFAQTYMGPIYGRPIHNHSGYNRGYGNIYGPGYNTTPFYRPLHNGGGAFVVPNARVYW